MGCCYDDPNPNPKVEKYNYFDNQYRNNTETYTYGNDDYVNEDTYQKKKQL